MSPGDAGRLGDPRFASPAQEPVPVPANPPRRAFVYGVEVRELFVRLKPSPMGPAHFVSQSGTWEFSRADLIDGAFEFGHGRNKLGATSILEIRVEPDGLHLAGHDGRRMWVPTDVLQTVNYLV